MKAMGGPGTHMTKVISMKVGLALLEADGAGVGTDAAGVGSTYGDLARSLAKSLSDVTGASCPHNTVSISLYYKFTCMPCQIARYPRFIALLDLITKHFQVACDLTVISGLTTLV
jgi:hypothetical protein